MATRVVDGSRKQVVHFPPSRLQSLVPADKGLIEPDAAELDLLQKGFSVHKV